MPAGPRPKPPATPKIQLMEAVSAKLTEAYPGRPLSAVEYLLNFFTAIDLQGILDELERRKG